MMNLEKRIASYLIVILGFILVTTLACGFSATPEPSPLLTPSATVNSEGILIFHSDRDGNNEIFTMQANGTGLTNLTNHSGDDIRPVWSPDGTRIVFNSDRDGQWGLYLMNADGSNLKLLVHTENPNWSAWSPDGKWILLSNGQMINSTDNEEKLVSLANDEQCSSSLWYKPDRPVWSPDGTKVACRTGNNSERKIAIWDVDQGNTVLLKVRRFNEFPAWSPDGSKIAFITWDTGFAKYNYIYTANLDGSGLTNLIEESSVNSFPVWSPDGSKIAYITRQYSAFEIQVMNADGTDKVRLTYNQLEIDELAWSPDGTRIAFIAKPYRIDTPEPGQPPKPKDIYIVNTDGSALNQITDGESICGGLSWQPNVP